MRLHVHTLLETGRVPIEMPDQEAAAAIGTEQARILCAVASRQIQSSSVARVTDRILAMNYQCDVRGHRGGGQASEPSGKRRGALPMPPHFSVTWNENGSVLYGTLKETVTGVTALYSDTRIPRGINEPGEPWDFVRTDVVGGSGFTPLAVLGFAELIRDAVRSKDQHYQDDRSGL